MKDQRKLQWSQRITFTPLSGHRLRCNWNGQVVPKRQGGAAYSRRWNELHPTNGSAYSATAQPISMTAYQVKKAEISRNGKYVDCPYCSARIYATRSQPLVAGETYCLNCTRRLQTVAPPPLKEALWTPWYKDSIYGSTDCPNCDLFLDRIPKGNTTCKYCNVEFVAVESLSEPAQAKATTLTSSAQFTSRAFNRLGDVECPECGKWHLDKIEDNKPISVECRCGTTFTALPFIA